MSSAMFFSNCRDLHLRAFRNTPVYDAEHNTVKVLFTKTMGTFPDLIFNVFADISDGGRSFDFITKPVKKPAKFSSLVFKFDLNGYTIFDDELKRQSKSQSAMLIFTKEFRNSELNHKPLKNQVLKVFYTQAFNK